MSDKPQVSEAVARPLRTAAQATPAWILTEFVDAWLFDMDERQFAVLVLLLTMLFSWAQAAYENSRGKGLFLRDVPPKHVALKESESEPESGPEEYRFNR